MKAIFIAILFLFTSNNAFAKEVKKACKCENEGVIEVFTLPIQAYEVSIRDIDKALTTPGYSWERINHYRRYETNLDLWKSKLRCMQILRDLKADLLGQLNICREKSKCAPKGFPKREILKAAIDELGKKILYYKNIIRTSPQGAGGKLRWKVPANQK